MHSMHLCKQYLAALSERDIAKVLALFIPGAVVVSPIYGSLAAQSYYQKLFADTDRSIARLKNVFATAGEPSSIALHFDYTWIGKCGEVLKLECVNVFELAADRHSFTKLTVIFDTAPLLAISRRCGIVVGQSD